MFLMELNESLSKAGLTGNESRVYLQLLKLGEQKANNVAKKISMDRTLTYTVLNHLIEKGLVNYVIKEKKKYFGAADPSNLLNPLREKEAFVRDAIMKLKTIQREEEPHQ